MGKTFMDALGPTRPPFLLLNPACVVLGVAAARLGGADLEPWHIVLVLLGAVAAHIAVNALNEYHDFKSGLDLKTERTPFSGGSGYLPANPAMGHVALITGVTACVVTALVGIYFIAASGPMILPLGLLGLLVILLYTGVFTRNPLLCLIAPGLGFGPLMVMGTEFALSGRYSTAGFVASLVPFFLVSDLLLLNQFPDADADRSVGRRHLIIVHGRKAGLRIYTLFLLAAFVPIAAGCATGLFPVFGYLALLPLVLAVPTILGVWKSAGHIPDLIPHMGRNVLIVLVTPVLLALGIFLGS